MYVFCQITIQLHEDDAIAQCFLFIFVYLYCRSNQLKYIKNYIQIYDIRLDRRATYIIFYIARTMIYLRDNAQTKCIRPNTDTYNTK